ncbi:MAG: hypothetical protein OXI91_11385 [Chloroflexota bacterium]|nr:hypothetical protein [Chloroflexota bacterium]
MVATLEKLIFVADLADVERVLENVPNGPMSEAAAINLHQFLEKLGPSLALRAKSLLIEPLGQG